MADFAPIFHLVAIVEILSDGYRFAPVLSSILG
jgi:hypothetical protein